MIPQHRAGGALGNGVLVCDIDGTLTAPGAISVPHSVISALRPFNRDGRLLISTGRHWNSVQRLFRQIGFVPTISLGGAALHLRGWDRPSSIFAMPEGVASDVLARCNCLTERVVLFTSESAFSPSPESFDRITCELLGLRPTRLRSGDLDRPILKVLIVDHPEVLNAVAESLRHIGVEVASSVQGYLDICAPGVHKALFFPSYLSDKKFSDGSKPHVVFIGDSFNDLTSAVLANESWTFKSAPEQLRKIATGVLPDNSTHSLIELFTNIRQSPSFRR